jgi:tetratricopeptide (TPR) repeat protein
MLYLGFRAFALALSFTLIVGCAGPQKKPAFEKRASKQEGVVRPQLSPEQEANYQKAVESLRQGDLPSAKRGFLTLLSAEPRLAGAQVNLGIIAQREGDKETAIYAFNQALGLNPRNADALAALGVIALEKGEYRKAESLLLEAVDLAPGLAIAHYNLGVLYELYLQEESDAIDHYKRYVALSSDEDVKTVTRWLKLLER